MDEILKKYASKNKDKVYALRNFLLIKNKPFSLKEALSSILDECGNNFDEASKIISYLTVKRKTYGRSQVYGSDNYTPYDLIRDDKGKIKIVGYDSGLPDKPKKVSVNDNPLKYRNDGGIKKIYTSTSDKVYDIGEKLRSMFPGASSEDIYNMVSALRDFAVRNKKSLQFTMNRISKGTLRFVSNEDGGMTLQPVVKENRVIIVKDLSVIREMYEPVTFYSFQFSIKKFLSGLLDDPVNTNIPDDLLSRGLTKKKAISYMLNHGIIEKDDKLVDKDNDGNQTRPFMKVRYRIPKKDFSRKIKRMFIYFFERNMPDEINEDGADGATSANISADGAYVQPLFSVQRRKIN